MIDKDLYRYWPGCCAGTLWWHAGEILAWWAAMNWIREALMVALSDCLLISAATAVNPSITPPTTTRSENLNCDSQKNCLSVRGQLSLVHSSSVQPQTTFTGRSVYKLPLPDMKVHLCCHWSWKCHCYEQETWFISLSIYVPTLSNLPPLNIFHMYLRVDTCHQSYYTWFL